MGTVVDLSPFKPQIAYLISKAVTSFTDQHPNVSVCTFGIHYSGCNPGITLAFEMAERDS